MKDNIVEFLEDIGIQYQLNVSLREKTWIHSGGKVNYWFIPDSKSKIVALHLYLINRSNSFEIVGNTSNIYFKNSYNTNCIISTLKLNKITLSKEIAECESGVNLTFFANKMTKLGYKGFSGLCGIPGTVGGAIYNNSSAFGYSLSEMLDHIDFISDKGNIIKLYPDDLCFERRSSILKKGDLKGTILSVYIKLVRAKNKDSILKEMEEYTRKRKENLEGYKNNLGSIFYQCSPKKKNIRLMMAGIIVEILYRLHLIKGKGYIFKLVILTLYGEISLCNYISNKTFLNTFIWRDTKAEIKFERYINFMMNIFDDLKMEIEIKE